MGGGESEVQRDAGTEEVWSEAEAPRASSSVSVTYANECLWKQSRDGGAMRPRSLRSTQGGRVAH